MSTSVILGGTHRSARAEAKLNPFTGEMQNVHTYAMTPDERAKVDEILARHGVTKKDDGAFEVSLVNERHPDGFALQGQLDEDGVITFFDDISLSKASCVILYDLLAGANLAADGDTFGAVASEAARVRLQDGGPDYSVVSSADDLYALIQSSLDE